MRNALVLVTMALLVSGLTVFDQQAPIVHGAAMHKRTCKTVTKRVHGKKRKVTVCHTVKTAAKPRPTRTPRPTATPTATPLPTATPTPTASPLLAEVSGLNTNLNAFLFISDTPCCFNTAEKTFLAPPHFQVRWTTICAPAHAGTNTIAWFSVVGYDPTNQNSTASGTVSGSTISGYDGTYQSVNLNMSETGKTSGTTEINATAAKTWTFYVYDAEKAQCSYELIAERVAS